MSTEHFCQSMDRPEVQGREPVQLPPGPRCTRCGHEPCPFCLPFELWCDDLDCPCLDADQGCEIDAQAAEAWLVQIEPLIDQAYREHRPVEHAEPEH